VSITINQGAIDALAQHPGVVRFVEDLAEEKAKDITETVQANVKAYFRNAETTVEQDVSYQTQAAGAAIIGIVDGYDGDEQKHSKSRRIADNPVLFPRWLREAVEAAGFRPA